MIDKSNDIFDQIDALLGKRGTEALAEHSAQVDDFPLLTEVIQVQPVSPSAEDAADFSVSERRVSDRRTAQRRATSLGASDSLVLDEEQLALLTVLEAKLNEMFRLKQIQLEAVFRLVIREEIRKILNR